MVVTVSSQLSVVSSRQLVVIGPTYVFLLWIVRLYKSPETIHESNYTTRTKTEDRKYN
jgi:hypothetical protein